MKNTVRKGFLFEAKKLCFLAVLALFVAGGVFAQRVGDTVTVSGQNWRVQELRDGRMVLQLVPTLNGTWVAAGGRVVTITGNSGVYTQMDSAARTRDAVNKGYIRVGDQFIRNLTSSGDLRWSGQSLMLEFLSNAPNVVTGVTWSNCTITMSADGQSFTLNAPAFNATDTYTRRQ